jgi:CRP-like cAMP-binding protein
VLNRIPPVVQASCLDCEARQFAWFESVSEDSLQEREKLRSGQYRLPANQYLFMEGDEHHTAYTLKEGWAICYKQLKDGQRQIVHIALPGDFLGYKTDPGAPIDYSVMAVTDCVLCAFSEKNINLLLQKDTSLIHRLIAIQTKQGQACRTRLSYVGQSQAKNKVAFFLMDLIERLERRGVDVGENVPFPLSRTDIADAIGITPVHLGRVSVELSQEEIVECRHNILNVKNYDKLRNMAGSV